MTTTQNTVADRLAAIEAMQQDYHEQCAERDRATGMRPGTYTEVVVPLADIDWLIAELKAAREALGRIAHTVSYKHVYGTANGTTAIEHQWVTEGVRDIAAAYLNRGAE